MVSKYSAAGVPRAGGNSLSVTSGDDHSIRTESPRTLKRSEILRGRERFQNIFRSKTQVSGKYLRCSLRFGDEAAVVAEDPVVKIGVAVGRSIRRAVDRSRIKRLVREAYRLNKHVLLSSIHGTGRSLGLIFYFPGFRPGNQDLPSFHDLNQDMKTIIQLIGRRCP